MESTDTYTERAPVVANLSSSELERPSKSLGAAADVDPLAHLERCIADITFESSEGVFITDAELVTLRVNNSFTRITGYSKRETIGFPSLILGDLYDDLLRDRCWNDEMLGRKKSGDIYTAKLRVKAVVDAHDRVTHYIATLNDLSAKKALQKKIAHLGFTDSLTGLKSRPALLISMQRAIDKCREQQTYAAILLIDIDDFKSHNVHSGHLAGDMLLQQSARRLRQVMGPSISIVRLFADKFVIVLEDLGTDTESAGVKGHHLAAGVRNCFSDAFDINAAIVKISVSMGLCLIGPNDTISTDVL
ncbi:MAG: diguanylate cyclase, partial [Rhodoferax sp.]